MAPRNTPYVPGPVTADWLRIGAIVYDQRLGLRGKIMDIGYPADDRRQADRAWLRPVGGGREWNPLIEDLGVANPGATGADHAS